MYHAVWDLNSLDLEKVFICALKAKDCLYLLPTRLSIGS